MTPPITDPAASRRALLTAAAVVVVTAGVSLQTSPASAQSVAISPRIVWMDSYFTPQRSNITMMAGFRVEGISNGLSPFVGVSLRGTEVSYTTAESPPADGVHAVMGLSGSWGDGRLAPYGSVGAGVITWRNPAWGDPSFLEAEAGLRVRLGARWALILAGRAEANQREPTLYGGTTGLSFGVGG